MDTLTNMIKLGRWSGIGTLGWTLAIAAHFGSNQALAFLLMCFVAVVVLYVEGVFDTPETVVVAGRPPKAESANGEVREFGDIALLKKLGPTAWTCELINALLEARANPMPVAEYAGQHVFEVEPLGAQQRIRHLLYLTAFRRLDVLLKKQDVAAGFKRELNLFYIVVDHAANPSADAALWARLVLWAEASGDPKRVLTRIEQIGSCEIRGLETRRAELFGVWSRKLARPLDLLAECTMPGAGAALPAVVPAPCVIAPALAPVVSLAPVPVAPSPPVVVSAAQAPVGDKAAFEATFAMLLASQSGAKASSSSAPVEAVEEDDDQEDLERLLDDVSLDGVNVESARPSSAQSAEGTPRKPLKSYAPVARNRPASKAARAVKSPPKTPSSSSSATATNTVPRESESRTASSSSSRAQASSDELQLFR